MDIDTGIDVHSDDNFNVRAKRIAITIILAFVLPALVLGVVYKKQFQRITDPTAMDMAQLARNLGGGKGFTTYFIRPLQITKSKDIARMPDMVNPPLYPSFLAVVMAKSPSDKKVAAASMFFFWLTILPLFALTRRLFNVRVAQLTILAYVFSVMMIRMAVTGLPVTMAAFLFTTMCLAMYHLAQETAVDEDTPISTSKVARFSAFSGALYALCYLTDYNLLLALLPVLLFIWYVAGRVRKLAMTWFLIALVVVAGPWWFRNLRVTGNPFFGLKASEIAMGTTKHPGLSLYRDTNGSSMLGYIQDDKSGILKKLVVALDVAYQVVPVWGQQWLAAFFVVGLFYSFKRPGANAIRGMTFASLLLVTILSGVFTVQIGSLAVFAPVLIAFAAAYFVRMLTDANANRVVTNAVSALAVGIIILPFIIFAGTARSIPPRVGLEAEVAQVVGNNAIIVTDAALEMAWYGGKRAIWLPLTEKDFIALDEIRPVQAIYLTRQVAPGVRSEHDYSTWSNVYWTFYTRGSRARFEAIEAGSLEGFQLYRDMPMEQKIAFLRSYAVLLMRPDAVKR
ncbi:MAG: glycosyltransferase family 39 protein [Armatimonadetes bacterium]|nr:glycosyltransferase family 39 protein [Armatimonadota bacterium]